MIGDIVTCSHSVEGWVDGECLFCWAGFPNRLFGSEAHTSYICVLNDGVFIEPNWGQQNNFSGWWWTFTFPFGTGMDVHAVTPPSWIYRKLQRIILGIHWEHRDG